MVQPLEANITFDTLDGIPEEHRPTLDTYGQHLTGAQVKARTTPAGGSGTRWCATSHTTLDPDGQGKFCPACAKTRHSKRAVSRRATPATHLPVDVDVLRRLHREADALIKVTNDYLDVRHESDRDKVVAALSHITTMGKILYSTIQAVPKPKRLRRPE